MVSGERNGFLDAAGLTFESLTSALTKANHKAMSLVAMSKKKV